MSNGREECTLGRSRLWFRCLSSWESLLLNGRHGLILLGWSASDCVSRWDVGAIGPEVGVLRMGNGRRGIVLDSARVDYVRVDKTLLRDGLVGHEVPGMARRRIGGIEEWSGLVVGGEEGLTWSIGHRWHRWIRRDPAHWLGRVGRRWRTVG